MALVSLPICRWIRFVGKHRADPATRKRGVGIAIILPGLLNRGRVRDWPGLSPRNKSGWPSLRLRSGQALVSPVVGETGRGFSSSRVAQACPDPMRCVPLLARRLAIALQDLINKGDRGLQLRVRPFGLLTRLGQGAANRLPHHAPVYRAIANGLRPLDAISCAADRQ